MTFLHRFYVFSLFISLDLNSVPNSALLICNSYFIRTSPLILECSKYSEVRKVYISSSTLLLLSKLVFNMKEFIKGKALCMFHSVRQLLWHFEDITAVGAQNCTPPSVSDFPPDLFTPEQRQAGAVVIHAIICCYLFAMLALICDDYFVPCIQEMCERK
jgi:hypothetical protein